MANLGQLRTRVRSYLDAPASNDSYWSDAELNEWINQSYFYYYMWIGETYDGYFAKDITIDLVANQAKYQLPADFWKVRLLERIYSTSTVPLFLFDRMEAVNITSGAGFSNVFQPTYRFEGNYIVIEPTPDVSITDGLRLEYLSTPIRMNVDADTPDTDFKDFWQETIVLRAVICAKQKEEGVVNTGADLASFGSLLQSLEQTIKEAAEQRSEQRRYTEQFGNTDLGFFYYY